MDPQQRILLETVYEGIDAGGFSIQDLKGAPIAVFVGQMNNDYYNVLIRDVDSAPQYFATGATLSIMSNRVSYFYDWKGPSATIDTACSSSMVALHMAVQALRNGEATMAVAAGVNLILGPEMFIFESKVSLSKQAHLSRLIRLSCTCSHQQAAHGCGMRMLMAMPEERASLLSFSSRLAAQ